MGNASQAASSGMAFRKSAAWILAVILGVAACGGGTAAEDESSVSPPTADSESDTPQRGGTLTFAAPADPDTLSFHTLGASILTGGGSIRHAIYGSLFHHDADGNMVNSLAESMSTEDGLTWTLVLRDGLAFTDGTPLDAEAVKWNFQKYAELPGRAQATANAIAAMTVIDDVTLEIELDEPNPVWQREMVRGMNNVGSPTARQEMGDEEFFNNPVGAGPFMLEEWNRGDNMVLVRNPDFHDDELPYLDELIIRPIGDESQLASTIVAGGADLGVLSEGQNVEQADQGGVQTHTYEVGGAQQLVMNHNEPPFDDRRMRRALNLAIDREALVDVVHAGQGGDEMIPETFFPEGNPFYVEEPSMTRHDPVEAQRLFDEYATENGGPTVFTADTREGVFGTQTEAIQAQLDGYDNIEMEVRTSSIPAFIESVRGNDFTAASWGASGQHPFPIITDARSGETSNVGQYSSPEMDEAIRGVGSLDEDEAREAMAEVQRLWVEDVPTIFLLRYMHIMAYDEDSVGGMNRDLWSPEFVAYERLWRR